LKLIKRDNLANNSFKKELKSGTVLVLKRLTIWKDARYGTCLYEKLTDYGFNNICCIVCLVYY